jgi:hypothetical protein
MTAFPPPAELTSHQPPALLVAELLAVGADGNSAQARLLNDHGLDLLQVIEGSAQTIAILMGVSLRAHGGGPAEGMLVGVKNASLAEDLSPAQRVETHISHSYTLSPFSLFAVRVTADGRTVAEFELKTMALKDVDKSATPA